MTTVSDHQRAKGRGPGGPATGLTSVRPGARIDRGGFDPLSDLFVAQFARPAHLLEVNLRTLSPYERALLVIDGTVTKFIEAYTMQPVDVVLLAQGERELPVEHEWLAAPAGTTVIAREVLLQARFSRQVHAYAASLIVPERVPATFQQALGETPGGLGRVLLNSGIENRREVLWYGRERLASLAPAVQEVTGVDVLSRTYRVVAGGRPTMVINEKFPIGLNPTPEHH